MHLQQPGNSQQKRAYITPHISVFPKSQFPQHIPVGNCCQSKLYQTDRLHRQKEVQIFPKLLCYPKIADKISKTKGNLHAHQNI